MFKSSSAVWRGYLSLALGLLVAALAIAGAGRWVAVGALIATIAAAWALLGNRREIAAWRKSERKLKEGARHADDIIAAIPSGLIGLDMNGEVCRWNEVATRILGMGRGGIIGQHVNRWPISGQKGLAECLKEALEGRTIKRGSLEVTRTDGKTIPLGISTSRLGEPGADDAGVVAIFQDLTDVLRIQTKMKQQERLAAVGTLAASIAHEIRNPLASIAGSVEMLASELKLKGELAELLELIIKESDRLNHLISSFLEFAREWQPKVTTLVPEQLLRETMQSVRLRPEAGKDLHLILRADKAPARIEADADMLKQVFLNLVLNACQAVNWRGEVSVTLEEQQLGDEDWAYFSFRDTGPGIKDSDRQHVFDPFFTTKPSGTGLGLAVAHRFAEIHGGHLELQEGTQPGAEFLFRIPARANWAREPVHLVTATDLTPVP